MSRSDPKPQSWRDGFWTLRTLGDPRSRALECVATDLLGFEDIDILKGSPGSLLRPLRFKPEHRGRRRVDYVSGGVFIHLLAERFVQLMVDIGATGYKTYEAVVDLDGEACDDYRALGVSGRAGPVNWKDTPVVPAMAENGMPLGGYDYMGLAFDVATWDGSDFFTTKGNAYILITSKVANAIIEAKLTNVRCMPLKEFRQVYDGDDF